MVRDGRKMRFFYHKTCFRGTADPRTQKGDGVMSTFSDPKYDEYHKPNAPNVSGLKTNLKVFQEKPPPDVGRGKWSVGSRGFQPSPSCGSKAGTRSGASNGKKSKSGSRRKTVRSKEPSQQKETK
jgi:hypothetical protein